MHEGPLKDGRSLCSYLEPMPATYNPALSQSDPLHRARLALGDTGFLKDSEGTSKFLLLDEEITAKISALGYAEGVAQCAEACVARVAQEPDEYEDEVGMRVKWNSRVNEWRDLARRLRSGAISTESSVNRGTAAIGASMINPEVSKMGLG